MHANNCILHNNGAYKRIKMFKLMYSENGELYTDQIIKLLPFTHFLHGRNSDGFRTEDKNVEVDSVKGSK